MKLDWMDAYYFADCAAQLLSDERPSKHPRSDPDTRSILRRSAVECLRRMWATGEPELRQIVVARVQVWCCYHCDYSSLEAKVASDAAHRARIQSIEHRLGLRPEPERIAA